MLFEPSLVFNIRELRDLSNRNSLGNLNRLVAILIGYARTGLT